MLSGVSAAVQMIMEGVPEPADLRATVHDGWTVVSVGRVAVAGYRSDDGGMRNMVAVTLTGLGFAGSDPSAGSTGEAVGCAGASGGAAAGAGVVRDGDRPPAGGVGQDRGQGLRLCRCRWRYRDGAGRARSGLGAGHVGSAGPDRRAGHCGPGSWA